MSQGAEFVENAAQRPHITAEHTNIQTVIHSRQTFVMYWHSHSDSRMVNPHRSYIMTAELRTQTLFCKPFLVGALIDTSSLTNEKLCVPKRRRWKIDIWRRTVKTITKIV